MTLHRPTGAAAALALALATAPSGTAAAAEGTRVEPVWFEPASPRTAASAGSRQIPALLNLPPGWTVGDAAAVVVGDEAGAEHGRRRLVAALIGEGAAVLEVEVRTARGSSPDTVAPPAAPTPRELLPDLFGALVALRRDTGAGLVVALGYGAAGGQAALLAAEDDAAAPLLGPEGARFAAAAALGPGRPDFAAGPAPPLGEGWPTRAPLLCATLAGAAASERREAERDCVAALAAPGPGQPVMAALADGRRRRGR